MKISELDKAEALIRMPEYLKDLDSLDSLRKKSLLRKLLKETRELERKYRLLRIVTPELVEDIKKFAEQRKELELKRLFIKPTRYQNFKIDLNRSKKENLFLLSHDYDMWKEAISQTEKELKIKRERERELIYDHWPVYDMHRKDGLNFSEIARNLSEMEGNPSHDDKLMAHYKAVRRAYRKAEGIIEQVRSEIVPPSKRKSLRQLFEEAYRHDNNGE